MSRVTSSSTRARARAVDRRPKNLFHPGEILLEEFLEPMGHSQAAFAQRIGWTWPRLNELIRGERGITAAAALDLADALGPSSRLWMNLQATCQRVVGCRNHADQPGSRRPAIALAEAPRRR